MCLHTWKSFFCSKNQKEEDRPITPDSSPQEEAGERLIDTSVADGATIEGAPESNPDLFEELREMDPDCNQVYGLANMEDLQRVSLYTANYCKLTPKAVQARGACLFASIRRNCTVPFEYTNTHLRRQIAMFMINMVEYLFPLLQVHIKGNYGHIRLTKRQYEAKERNNTLTDQERTDYLEPGLFSLVSYIEAFLVRDFYGNEITRVLISMMWQMRITIIHAETLFQTKIHHSNAIHLADMVVFRTKLNHYFPASKCPLCPLCNSRCSNSQKLKNHIRTKHQEVTSYQCATCGNSFGDSFTLKTHIRTHKKPSSTKRLKCRICGRRCDAASHLVQHKKDHTGEGGTCQYCGLHLAQIRSLPAHESSCKKNPANIEMPRVKQHICPDCSKAYFNKKDLNHHRKIHHAP